MSNSKKRIATIKTSTGNGHVAFRSTPTDNVQNLLYELAENTQVELLQDKPKNIGDGNWYYIKHQQQDGWVFHKYVQNIKEIPTEAQPTPDKSVDKSQGKKLMIDQKTPFKEYPVDTKDLNEEARKRLVYMSGGTILNISSYQQEANHYRFTLADGQKIDGKETWYVYDGHARIA
ncbi:MAG: hypothetical protein WA919_12900 [Coleofasciculaceae cyanobacterium]